tara:strand:+ start:218 stop:514 length:297 start_codon:yes stop_codon:yes gene_type:complete
MNRKEMEEVIMKDRTETTQLIRDKLKSKLSKKRYKELMSRRLCYECASPDINIFKDSERKGKKMDCYCNKCKEEQYTVSFSWWLGEGYKRNFKQRLKL